jgi:hypothetical protein
MPLHTNTPISTHTRTLSFLSSRLRCRWSTASFSAAYRPHILCTASASAAASIAAAASPSLTLQQRCSAVCSALAYTVAFVATLLCPTLHVSPSSGQHALDDRAATAAHVVNVYVVAGLCGSAVAAMALAQRGCLAMVALRLLCKCCLRASRAAGVCQCFCSADCPR